MIRGDFYTDQLDSVPLIFGETRLQKGESNAGGRPIKTSIVSVPLFEVAEDNKQNEDSAWDTVDFSRLAMLCECLSDCETESRLQCVVKIWDGNVPSVYFPPNIVKVFADLEASIDVDIYYY